MKKNIAVVGAGYWGSNLVRNFHKLGVLNTIADYDVGILLDMELYYHESVTITQNYDHVLNNPDIEGVVIATPAGTHFKLAAQAIAAGKDVFIEKPMALSSEEGQRLCDLAEGAGRMILVGHVLEYHPAIAELYRIVKSGQLGRLQYIYSNRLNMGKFRTNENVLWSFAPHDISIMLSLTGQMPVRAVTHMASFITKGVADVTVTGLEFPDGVKGHIFVSWLHPYKEQRLVVIGDKGMVTFNGEVGSELIFYNKTVGFENNIPVPENRSSQVIEYDKTEPLTIECLDFIRAIGERKAPMIDGKQGVKVLKVLEMCQAAMKE